MGDFALDQLVRTIAPQRLLLLGACARAIVIDYLAAGPACEVIELAETDQLTGAHSPARFDLGVVCGVIEQLDARAAGVLIARLRDIFCQRLLLVVPIGAHWGQHRSIWQQTDLLAYGFTLLSSEQRNGRLVQVYGFDLATYKSTPDWLNSKYWAHPELFNKYWW